MAPIPPNDAYLGRKLGGRVELLARLGSGGMGAVYKGWHLALNQPVAVKVLSPTGNQIALGRRLAAEIAAARRIDHPNVVKVIESGVDAIDNTLYVVMEHVEGRDLERLLADQKQQPIGRACLLTQQILEGLAAAHALGVLHRDIKPGNVMLTRARGDDGAYRDLVKLVDFGLAKVSDGTQLTDTGMTVGTPGYMSPEQAMGQPLDGRSDLYSVAVTLYRMIAGRLPFSGERLAAVLQAMNSDSLPISGIPPELQVVLRQALSRTPEARFESAEAFSLALEPFVHLTQLADAPAAVEGIRVDAALGIAPNRDAPAPKTAPARRLPPPPTPSAARAPAPVQEAESPRSASPWAIAAALVIGASLSGFAVWTFRDSRRDAVLIGLTQELAFGHTEQVEQQFFRQLPQLANDRATKLVARRLLELRRAEAVYPYDSTFHLEPSTFVGDSGGMPFRLTISSLTEWSFEGALEWTQLGITALVRGVWSGNELLFSDIELTQGSMPGYRFDEIKLGFVLRAVEGVVLVGFDGPERRPVVARRQAEEGNAPKVSVPDWPLASYVTEPQLLAYLRWRAARTQLEKEAVRRTMVVRRDPRPEEALTLLRVELKARERRATLDEVDSAQRAVLDGIVDSLYETRLIDEVPTLVPRPEPQRLAELRGLYGPLADRVIAHQVLLLTK